MVALLETLCGPFGIFISFFFTKIYVRPKHIVCVCACVCVCVCPVTFMVADFFPFPNWIRQISLIFWPSQISKKEVVWSQWADNQIMFLSLKKCISRKKFWLHFLMAGLWNDKKNLIEKILDWKYLFEVAIQRILKNKHNKTNVNIFNGTDSPTYGKTRGLKNAWRH